MPSFKAERIRLTTGSTPFSRCCRPYLSDALYTTSAALALGWLSLTTARESAIGQYGLIHALPPLYFLSLAMLAVSFILSWCNPHQRSLEFILSLTILVVLLQGAPGMIESEPRFAPRATRQIHKLCRKHWPSAT